MRRKRNMTLKQINVRQAYEEFFQDKKSINTAEETLSTYRLHISNFLSNRNLWDAEVSSISKNDYQQWIEVLQKEPAKKDVTVASYCRSVRVFIYWLQNNQYIPEAYSLKIPSYQKTIKVCYTDEELSLLLKKPEKCSEVQYQTWVFVNLACATGMRLASILSLDVSDIIWKENLIYLQKTKNKRAQIFFVNNEMLTILKTYITLFGLTENDSLFCSAEKGRLSKRTMQTNVANFNHSRNVKKTSIHLFRHTFAKNFYSYTKDIYTLAHILGHSSIATTEKYLRDLGINPADATAYNPQLIYAGGKPKPKRRRSSITADDL
ncbi:tyrosine-type recombinase/integrase [Frisingicoccus sp.]|uniref:tyrosine-type recombinase/integrase n=1 Tax=Frisingicoccus sp. TaxID=1918627 RepID=UPI003AB51791